MKRLELSFSALRRARRIVLRGATLELSAGRGIGVIGLNGSGKTTFLMAAAGLLHDADFTMNGIDARSIVTGYLAQNAPLPPWLGVPDVCRVFGTTLPAAAAAWPGLRLGELERLGVRGLTPGQRQALGAAAVLTLPADVFVLDEPFAGLDFHRQTALRSILAEFSDRHTVFISAQSITDLLGICDRFILLRAGTVVFAGGLEDLGVPAAAGPDLFEKAVTERLIQPGLEVSA